MALLFKYSFLREKGIRAPRFNPYSGRLLQGEGQEQGDNSNNVNNAENQDAAVEQNNNIEQEEGVGEHGGSSNRDSNDAENEVADEDEGGNEDEDEAEEDKTTATKGKQPIHAKKRIDSDKSCTDVMSKVKIDKMKGKAKGIEKGKEKGKEKENGKRKAKGKGKDSKKGGCDSESDSDSGPVSKRKKVDDLVKFCQRCLRRYIPNDEEPICAACETIPKGSQKGTSKLASVKKRRARLIDDLVDGSILSLKDMCMKLIAANIDAVEAVSFLVVCFFSSVQLKTFLFFLTVW
jgi:hypothetical protein